MPLQECSVNVNRELKELRPHGTLDFPCAGYSALYADDEGDIITWHWHEEMEIVYVMEGCMEFRVSSRTFMIREGDGFAVNSNVLHYGATSGSCRLLSLVFSPLLITGNDHSVFARKYLQPLTACRSFSGYPVFCREDPDMLRDFLRAFDAMEKEPPGFEFIVRENLSRICFSLTEKLKSEIDTPGTGAEQNDLRIRKMIEFIHKNYSREIFLSEIAGQADIGERECLRCFQKTIRCSPIQYLLKYRIMKGAEMLLLEPGRSICDIALSCGFGSASNFAQLFKRFYNRTPREYRKAGSQRHKDMHLDTK